MKDLAIRKAKLADLKIIQVLNHKLFLNDSKFDNTLNGNWPYKEGKKYFKKAIKEDYALCLVAEYKSEIIGYLAAFIWRFEPFLKVKRAELENMFVQEEYRSLGIGSKLVKEFFRWCKDKGVKKGRVVTFTRNKKAINFYMKNGFKDHEVKLEVDIK